MLFYSREKTDKEKMAKLESTIRKVSEVVRSNGQWLICSHCRIIFESKDQVFYDAELDTGFCPHKGILTGLCKRTLLRGSPEYFMKNYKVLTDKN